MWSATNVTVEILPKLQKLMLHSLIQELMKQDIDMKEILHILEESEEIYSIYVKRKHKRLYIS